VEAGVIIPVEDPIPFLKRVLVMDDEEHGFRGALPKPYRNEDLKKALEKFFV
jgi:hypothetical protein